MAATEETSERYLRIARRWFTDGRTGDRTMADEIFSADVTDNGVLAGVAGPGC